MAEQTPSKLFSFLVRRWKLLTLLGVLISFGIAIWYGSRQSIWFDEAYSISLIQSSYSKLLHLTAIDAHPPFYYLALKIWSSIFGEGEIALRAFSALCGSLAVGFSVLLVKRLFNARVAIIALPFVVFAPFLVRYNFEVRMYALASLIGVTATYVMVTALQTTDKQRSRKLWIVYALLVALGMYTLYFTVLLWVTHAIWLLFRRRHNLPRQSFFAEPWVRAYIGSFLLFLPWFPTFINQLLHPVGSGVTKAVDYTHITGIFSFGMRYEAPWQLGAWGSLIILLSAISIVYVVIKALQALDKAQKQNLMLLVLYLLVPFALLAIASLPPFSPRYLERYMSHAFIGSYLLIGTCIGILLQTKLKTRSIIIGLFLFVVMGFGMYRLYHSGNYIYERLLEPQSKEVAAQINCQPGDIVLAGEPMIYYELHYYLPQCQYRFFNVYGDINKRGGFASLYGSSMQIRKGDKLDAPRVFYVYLDNEEYFELLNYKLQNVIDIGKYHIGTYVLK